MPEEQETLNLRFIFKVYDQGCVVNSHFCLIISLFSFSLSANQNTLKSLLVQVQKYSKTVEKEEENLPETNFSFIMLNSEVQ